MAVGDFIEEYDFETLMDQALEQVPEGIDTREGSIIYDALAPACMQLAELYLNLMNLVNDSFPSTAIGEYLDLKAQEQGLERLVETTGTKIATFKNIDGEPMDVPLTSRFSTIGEPNFIYRVIEKVEMGEFILECETAGSSSNTYLGEILPVDNISDLGQCLMTEVYIAGRDTESDEDLRERYFQIVQQRSFGGNVSDYIQQTKLQEGVGDCQVYPTWNGGGTVGISLIDNSYHPVGSATIERIKNYFDPEDYTQLGQGMSPIGHKVSVNTPTLYEVNISAEVTSSNGEDVLSLVKEKLEEYFLSLRKEWGTSTEDYEYKTSIYVARVLVILLQTPGVVNVTNVKLQGEVDDIHLTHSFENNPLPVLGEVSLV